MSPRLAPWLVTVGALLVAAAGLEMGLRLFLPQPLGLSYLSPEGVSLHIPGARVRYVRREFANTVAINSLGLRGPEVSLPKPAGVFRILVLGDSFVEGKQVAEDEVFSRRLETALRKQFPDRPWDVVNGGVSGYGTGDEIGLFELYGRRLSPDVVILAFYLGNDWADNRRSHRFRWQNERLVEAPPQTPSSGALFLARLKEMAASHSHLVQFLRDRLGGMRADQDSQEETLSAAGAVQPPAAAPGDDTKEDVRLTEALLDELARRVAAVPATLMIVGIPARREVVGREGVDRGLAELRRELAGYCAARDVPFLDLLPALREAKRDHTPYYRIDAHWNASGHAVAAAAALDWLVKSQVLGKTPPAS